MHPCKKLPENSVSILRVVCVEACFIFAKTAIPKYNCFAVFSCVDSVHWPEMKKSLFRGAKIVFAS